MFDLTRNPVLMCGTPEFSTVNTKCSGHGQYINDMYRLFSCVVLFCSKLTSFYL